MLHHHLDFLVIDSQVMDHGGGAGGIGAGIANGHDETRKGEKEI